MAKRERGNAEHALPLSLCFILPLVDASYGIRLIGRCTRDMSVAEQTSPPTTPKGHPPAHLFAHPLKRLRLTGARRGETPMSAVTSCLSGDRHRAKTVLGSKEQRDWQPQTRKQ